MITWLTLAMIVHAVLLLAIAVCLFGIVAVLRGSLFPFDEADQILPFDDGDDRKPAA